MTLTWRHLTHLLPNRLEILFQAHSKPLYLSGNNLLGDVLGESSAIPNERIVARQKRGKKGRYFFFLWDRDGNYLPMNLCRDYPYAAQCRVDGAIQFARQYNPSVLSKHISRLVTSSDARKQVSGRECDGGGEYFLIHNNNGRTKSKREVVGVARYVSKTKLVFAHFNDQYGTMDVDFCICDNAS